MNECYAGLDLASRSSWLCLGDSEGRELLSRRVPSNAGLLPSHLQPFGLELTVAAEATFNWY